MNNFNDVDVSDMPFFAEAEGSATAAPTADANGEGEQVGDADSALISADVHLGEQVSAQDADLKTEQTETSDQQWKRVVDNQQAAATRRMRKAEDTELRAQAAIERAEQQIAELKRLKALPGAQVDKNRALQHIQEVLGAPDPESAIRTLIGQLTGQPADPGINGGKGQLSSTDEISQLKQELQEMRRQIQEQPQQLKRQQQEYGIQMWKDQIGRHVDSDDYPALQAFRSPEQLADAAYRVYTTAVEAGADPSDQEILQYLNDQVVEDWKRLSPRLQRTKSATVPVARSGITGIGAAAQSAGPKTKAQIDQDALDYLNSWMKGN